LKRGERHQLKQDDFLTSVERGLDWSQRHRHKLLVGLVAVLGVAVVGGGIILHRGRQARAAASAFHSAMDVYRASVGPGTPEAPPGAAAPRYATSEERDKEALAALDKIASDQGRSAWGRQALYYAALCRVRLGQGDEAKANLEQLTRGRQDLIHYAASQALAGLHQQRGETEAALALYRSLVEDPKNPMPKDRSLFELARLVEGAGRPDEARQAYDRLIEEYPSSQLRTEAEARRRLLDGGSSAS
jgi:tetratricopeptide (TPR) repeat protein